MAWRGTSTSRSRDVERDEAGYRTVTNIQDTDTAVAWNEGWYDTRTQHRGKSGILRVQSLPCSVAYIPLPLLSVFSLSFSVSCRPPFRLYYRLQWCELC